MLAHVAVVVMLAVILSVFSYYFIENTIRFSKSKLVFIALLLIMGLIGIAALIINNKAP